MTDTTSSGDGVTPTTGSPVTGTPAAPGSVTPQTAALSHEDAMKRLADLERSLNNAKEENDRHSKNLTARERELAVYKQQEEAAKLAALSDVDKANKRAADLEAQLKQRQQQLVMARVELVAKDKGILNPELYVPYLQSQLEYGDDGMPTNLEKVLDALIKANPFIAKQAGDPPATTPASPAQTAQPQQTPALPAFAINTQGRGTINPPAGGAQPGYVRLGTYDGWKH